MSLFMSRWFGIGLDVLENIKKLNSEKIALLKKSDEVKYHFAIERLVIENEEIDKEIERREKEEETN